MSEPRILVTNDDGIESPGFRALYEALEEVGDPVAVAPYSNQSAVGRARSFEATVHDYDLGYAVEGTPVDCVIAGLEALCPDADMVVAGCNKGANLGSYVMGRSGTVSAAVEATFFDVPAIAVSQYVPTNDDEEFEHVTPPKEAYKDACDAAAYLVDAATGDGDVFAEADYLNVNAPAPDDSLARPPMRITEPSPLYAMSAKFDGEEIRLEDNVWQRMQNGDIPDEEGTDRRAVVDGEISVSPLTAPHTVERHERLDDLAAAYTGDRATQL
ncbi:5'/3'-nucleotidase SurE [Halolamina litorea]|uniref:5'-nucleotidase SurE n=1 Tax=Halolamina litorea TaxID=1515593 RepID=A0ABD6BQ01_9EURY|nr:5'/3'-nucleotidase SurE [Halolamina litorea]